MVKADENSDIDMDENEMEYCSDNYSPYTPPQLSAADKLKTQSGKQGSSKKKNKKGGKGGNDSGTSSGEERWLDAIESGKLEEVDDELKKIKPKDPKLMTARQRAMYEKNISDKESNYGMTPQSSSMAMISSTTFLEGVTANISGSGELLLALPTGYKEKEKLLTEEAIQKAQQKSIKRKQLADEKREKDKKKTMERLLKKQDSKAVKSSRIRPSTIQKLPMISYKHTVNGATLFFPISVEFPIKAKLPIDPPKPTICGITGCKNIKRYNCSKTNIPLCSYACYKQNVASIKNIIC